MTNAQVQFAPQTQTAEADTPQIALLPPPVHDETALAHSESRNTQHATRIDPSTIQNPASVHQPSPALRPRTRNGKVARLPFPQRDMINRMLRNNIPHSRIVDALDEHGIK